MGQAEFTEGLFVSLCLEFHPAEIVVGKGVVRGKFYSTFQHVASRGKLVFGPPEKTEIAIRIFQSWIEANRFLIFGGSFGILAQLDQQDPTKVTSACVIGMFALRGGELFEGILRPILA